MRLIDFLASGVAFAAAAHAVAVVLLAAELLSGDRLARTQWWGSALVLGVGALVALAVTDNEFSVAIVVGVLFVAVAAGFRRLRRFRASGVLLCVSYVALLAFMLFWTAGFVATLSVGGMTQALMVAAVALTALGLPVALVRILGNWEVLCRREWRRPRKPVVMREHVHGPLVSIHVPVHAEPPEVVIATLDCLDRLNYPNFEVLVIDNNTSDPGLWRPVQTHCQVLGERFRFFHVEGLTGAKAGALNFALPRTDPTAVLVALIDADYQAKPDFLAGTVGYFDDPTIGFVQTPHAYRDWEDSAYLSMCAWEYAYCFATDMVSLNERDAAVTVGTMCVIRRRALQDAGGWAEWCLTEDSELAIRIHALGYSSVYLNHVYGRGLIPDTFAGYKRQRFRWTYGPIQEFKCHLRLYLPGRWRQPSQLSTPQRIHHAAYGLYGANHIIGLVCVLLAASLVASMTANREVVVLPVGLRVAVMLMLVSHLTLRLLVYRAVLGARLRDTAGAMLASAALTHVITVASIWGILGRAVAWGRTDKFRRPSRMGAAFQGVRTELVVAMILLSLGTMSITTLPDAGLATMLAIGLALQGLIYLAAPAMALLAERDLSRALKRDGISGSLAAAQRADAAPSAAIPASAKPDAVSSRH
jgi:hypothetical protein